MTGAKIFKWIDEDTSSTYFELQTNGHPSYEGVDLVASKTYGWLEGWGEVNLGHKIIRSGGKPFPTDSFLSSPFFYLKGTTVV